MDRERTEGKVDDDILRSELLVDITVLPAREECVRLALQLE